MSQLPNFAFAGTGRDRGHAQRADAAALAQLLAAGAPVLALWRGQPLIQFSGPDSAPALCWLPLDHPIFKDAGPTIYLGENQGQAAFAADISSFAPEEGTPSPEGFDAGRQPHPAAPTGAQLCELRQIMAQLRPDDAELAATARALVEWHRRNSFCSACGAKSEPAGGGWRRDCPSCKVQHFPRTDPVVIMLVLRGNQALIGRSPGWPEGMYSTLAGFIEPGETLEAAVRREVAEETGITCGKVRYIASQPWPFPANLMIGCLAEAETSKITLDPVELDDAIWITREDLAAVFAGESQKITLPRAGSIARFLLENWLADRLD